MSVIDIYCTVCRSAVVNRIDVPYSINTVIKHSAQVKYGMPCMSCRVEKLQVPVLTPRIIELPATSYTIPDYGKDVLYWKEEDAKRAADAENARIAANPLRFPRDLQCRVRHCHVMIVGNAAYALAPIHIN